MTVLEARDVVSGYGEVEILHGVSIKVEEGEIVTIIGPNGAGKSTLLKTVFGLLPCKRGAVFFDGENVTGHSPQALVRKGMSYVPQSDNVFPSLTVQENLEMGAFSRKDKAEIRQNLERVFKSFPRLKERLNQLGGTLSGGEQQMLAIGRGLMAQPKVLLLDEPSMGLAPILVEEIFSIIKEINAQSVAILLVEQNALMALSVANRGYVLETGRIVLEGSGQALLQDPQVMKAYLGGH